MFRCLNRLIILILCALIIHPTTSVISADDISYPELAQNSNLVVRMGHSATIQPSQLRATDSVAGADGIYYSLKDAPDSGTLMLDGKPLEIGDDFTQEDINAGRLQYVHTTTGVSSDTFKFSLTRGPLLQRASLHADGSPVEELMPCPNYLSSDGRVLVFKTFDDNVVAGDTNGKWDLFSRNLDTGEVNLISRGYDGGESNGDSITESGYPSADGRYVTFDSKATNLVEFSTVTPNAYHAYRYDRLLQKMTRVDPLPLTGDSQPGASAQGMSEDGQVVLYRVEEVIDGKGQSMLYTFDFRTEKHELIATQEGILWGFLSPDGQLVASNHGVIYDRLTKSVENVPVFPGDYVSISRDNRYLAMIVEDDIIPGDDNGARDVFVYDRILKTYEQLSFASDDMPGPGSHNAMAPAISADGRYVSYATIKRVGEVSAYQVILHDRQTGKDQLVSTSLAGQPGNGHSLFHSLSADGSRLSFYSEATNLVSDGSSSYGVYVRQFPPVDYTFTIEIIEQIRTHLPLILQ